MRRFAALLLVSSVLIGASPALAAAEDCGAVVIRADFEGSLPEGVFTGSATMWMAGVRSTGDLFVQDNGDGSSFATYTFESGSFTTFDFDTIQLSNTIPGLVFLGFTGEVVDGDGAFAGVTGSVLGRGHFFIDEAGFLSDGLVRVTGELCSEGVET